MTTFLSTTCAPAIVPERIDLTKNLPLLAFARPAARALPGVIRTLLGLAFIVCALDVFLHVLPVPAVATTARAAAFRSVLLEAGYFLPLVKGVEMFGGTLLLANRSLSLAAVLIAPIVVNVVLLRVF